jgi:hypothetical protein
MQSITSYFLLYFITTSGRKDLDLDEKDEDGKAAEDYARERENLRVLAIIR